MLANNGFVGNNLSSSLVYWQAIGDTVNNKTLLLIVPLTVAPVYEASGDNAETFYATIGDIFRCAVVGGQFSPISDTTILTSLATDCDLLAHITSHRLRLQFLSTCYPSWLEHRRLASATVGIYLKLLTIVFFPFFFRF